MTFIDDVVHEAVELAERARRHGGHDDRGGLACDAGEFAVDLTVDPENVLHARRALLDEADRLTATLVNVRHRLRLTPMGGDPASIEFARIVTGRLLENPDSYFNRCRHYVENLRAGAQALAETAQQYGYTEDEIADSLRSPAIRPGEDD
ncbi:hypothetical protein FHR81_002937 [Actinoalloteichus hoggarensis]|nr:hypothetical protein [Actinoalloteichus hoggarensis]MBB5921897.1 hypothetical protein [Actinoalloteichus hoggarensis]